MENNSIRILSTRPVDESTVQEVVAKGIQVDVVSFIDTVTIENDDIKIKIDDYASKNCIVIFTSMNAVNAVVNQLKDCVPAWTIFCLGNTTRQLVESYFGNDKIIGIGSNATELANALINWKSTQQSAMPVVFFCGDQRRDELPARLHQHDIYPEEIITYKTIETTQIVKDAYSGILLFSPSAVHSFFKKNKAATDTVFFAIGETTANAISVYTNNKIITGNTPAKGELLKLAVEWLSTTKKFQV